MKKGLFFSLLSAVLSLCLTACESVVSGTFLYSLHPAEDASNGAYNSYWASGAEEIMCKAIEKTAKPFEVGYKTFKKDGELKECDKAIKAAFDQGVREVENAEDYNEFFILTGFQLQLTRSDVDDPQQKVVVAEHIFK